MNFTLSVELDLCWRVVILGPVGDIPLGFPYQNAVYREEPALYWEDGQGPSGQQPDGYRWESCSRQNLESCLAQVFPPDADPAGMAATACQWGSRIRWVTRTRPRVQELWRDAVARIPAPTIPDISQVHKGFRKAVDKWLSEADRAQRGAPDGIASIPTLAALGVTVQDAS